MHVFKGPSQPPYGVRWPTMVGQFAGDGIKEDRLVLKKIGKPALGISSHIW